MLRRTSILIVLTLAHLAAAPSTTVPATRPTLQSTAVEKAGVSLTLVVHNAAIPADEQPKFVIRFSNKDTDYINLYDVDAFWNWQFRITRVDACAADAGWKLRFNTIPFRYPIAHRQIKAGESLEVAINLNDPPFTFDYVQQDVAGHAPQSVRNLPPGIYQLDVTVALPDPVGRPGYHEWLGPLTTARVPLDISTAPAPGSLAPTAEELASYQAAIDRVAAKLQPYGLWLNGGFPDLGVPADATDEQVIAGAVNAHLLGSKAYRIHLIRRLKLQTHNVSAALVKVGETPHVLVFFRFDETHWWTRFYEADLSPPSAPIKPAANPQIKKP